ncbi:MAG: metallophosphoesterase [Candidatus Kapaibacteriota bacterium]
MKYLKFFLILLPYLMIITIIFFFTNGFQINDKNSNPIYGFEYTNNMIEKDQSYIFYNGNRKKIIFVSENNKIEQKTIADSSIAISPICDKKISFNVKIKKSLNIDSFKYNYSKVLAISDIEGNFNIFSQFLINTKVIDKNFNWIFGNGHLVCNGDFFDRGDDVTACLWLIYKLEQEAEKQGGKVHYIIGNHEEMNLRGNVKYVHLKYKALADKLKIPYKELYSKDSELGRWLRTKNSVIKINDILFSHGGLSPALVNKKYTLEEINNFTQKYIGEDEDYLKFINPRASFIFDRQGPMWYRGYFGDYKEHYKGTSQKDIDKILNYYEANHIVVGHTIVDKVQTLFNNKVIAIDAMSENDPRKQDDDNMAVSCEGLFIENNQFYRVLFNGKKELLFKK